MGKLKSFIIGFSIPLCALGVIIAKVIFAVKRQEKLLFQYDFYLFCLIFIISIIFSIKRKKTNDISSGSSY